MRSLKKLSFALVIATGIHANAQPQDAKSDSYRVKAFVNALMKKMTLDEKIGQLNLLTPGDGVVTGAVVSKDVETKIKAGKVGGLFGVIGVEKIRQAQDLAVNGSRLHIPLIFGSDVIHGYKTTYPIPLASSCSWDTAMIRQIARESADEASADGLCWTFSPMVDIARDPRWGRIAEGAGEDPFLGAQIAKSMVKGYQGNDLSKNNTILACVKHYALYGAAEGGRDYNTVDMSRIKMYNDYLPPYKAAVEAGVRSVMTSFNEVDGVPASGNKWLMTDVLRKQWGFKGFVVTDYTAINEMINHGMGDLQTVSALALKAEVDMDMVGEGFLTTLKKSLSERKITINDIDNACRRILEAKYELGLFEDPYRYCNTQRAAATVMSQQKRTTSKNFAEHSVVLLKNTNQTLPLKKSGTIALIGPLANDRNNMLGTWAVSGDPKFSIPVLDGMKNVAGSSVNIIYEKGANISDDTTMRKRANVFGERISVDKRSPEQMINDAVAAANKADVVVAVLGEASEMSGESASRSDIDLPESQRNLLDALSKTGKPFVLVIMSGRPLVLTNIVDKATAILQAWFLGHEAGNAIADVLFGNYNPSGKTTISFPRNVGQIPVYYNHKNTGRPQPPSGYEKFTSNYLDVENDPLYPFGYGLSYTTFSYGGIKLSQTTIKNNEKITATVTVSNTGNYDGEEVVQLYIRDLVGSVTRPVKELKGFQKIFLKKGESRQVTFTIRIDDLKFYNALLQYVAEPGDFKIYIGTNSQNVKEGILKLTK